MNKSSSGTKSLFPRLLSPQSPQIEHRPKPANVELGVCVHLIVYKNVSMLQTQIWVKIWFQVKADFSAARSVTFDFIMDEEIINIQSRY